MPTVSLLGYELNASGHCGKISQQQVEHFSTYIDVIQSLLSVDLLPPWALQMPHPAAQ